MTSDQNEVNEQNIRRSQDEDKSGHKDPVNETASYTKPTDESEDETSAPDEIKVAIVDEITGLESKNKSVETHVEPSAETSRITSEGLTVTTVDAKSIELSRVEHRVESRVRPEAVVSESKENEVVGTVTTQIPVVESVAVEKTDDTVSQTVAPAEELEESEEFEVTTVQPSVEKMNHSVSQQIELQQSSTMEEPESDEEDPVFAWGGGTPYGSRKPKLVIHKNHKNDEDGVNTLPFLQVLLRDTYKEINGGEPDGETVEFVGNEPRVPGVQKSIVTLDLTEGGWSAEIRGGEPVIQRVSDDIVPKLREVASTLYTGETGYFVVDVPAEWNQEAYFTDETFFEKLVARLTESDASGESDEEEEGGFGTSESTPVIVAEPKFDGEDEFSAKVSRYFSFDANEGATDVHRTEEEKEHVLRKNDWKRVALTERQSTGDGESDEHYFWKAAMVEGVALEMWRCYEETEEVNSFSDFVEEEILSESIIETESELMDNDDKEDDGPTADVKISSDNGEWAKPAVEQFLNLDEDTRLPMYLEFETGRSEGAFNFRKIRDTLEKYENESGTVRVVLPPRLLFRGRKRADMITHLVENWDENEARAYVPVLNGSYCETLEPAEDVVEELYGGNEE